MITPEQGIEEIHKRFGSHPRHRALHAKGTICEGSFTATPEAARLTRAAHMQGDPVMVTARVSNGGGNPKIPDYERDVRGMAVAFHLRGGERTDIVSQTAPNFVLRGVDPFFDLLRLSRPSLGSAIRFPWFLARNPGVLKGLRENLAAMAPPASYAAVPYFAIHAFRWIDAGGGERWVRYTWKPHDPAPRLSGGEAKQRGRDYLQEDIAERIAAGGVRFDLEIQVAGEGEDPHDPSSVWADGERTTVGTMELSALAEGGDEIIFDPMRLVDGIEPSDDPVLHFRPKAYSISYDLRTSAERESA